MSQRRKPANARIANFRRNNAIARRSSPGTVRVVVDTAEKPARKKRSAFNFKKVGSALGGIAGATIGASLGPLGSMAGGWLGEKAASFLGKVTGLGDYRISYNSFLHGAKLSSGDSVPVVRNTHSGIRICHREFITDVLSTTNFANNPYNINPGIAATFPWLSAVAQNFQQYKVHGMVFTFTSTSGDALTSTDTALGTVIMGTNYNSAAAAFLSKQQMENNEYTVSTKPSNNLIHMIECDPKETLQEAKFYIRTGALAPSLDIKTYDIGLFQVATVGQQASAVNIGELHVSYDIELMKPVDLSLLDQASGFCHAQMGGTIAASSPFGTAKTVAFDNIGMTFSTGGLNFNFPKSVSAGMQFQVTMIWYGTSTATVVVPSIATNYCSAATLYNGSTTTAANNTSTTASVLIYQLVLTILNTASPNNLPSLVCTTNTITLPGGTVSGDIFISQIPAAAV